MTTNAKAGAYPHPATRRLRVYAFDPQASLELATAQINDAVISLPWETPWEEPLTKGPCNDYLEVIDHDPASSLFYAPVDLNDPHLLAQDGLPPSEGRPQFHQQMVFAVAMRTIRLFERALGRPVFWIGEDTREQKEAKEKADRPGQLPLEHPKQREVIRKLRVYPHALREANAYYSPEKTALLFGYFKKGSGDDGDDNGWVFTCLSQDIIAHETTHAILHGLSRRSIEASNPDSLAFHEGFADIVALFQHFTMTDVVAHQIGHSRGSLRGKNLLTGLARQFGEATGRNGSLRYALQLLGDEAKSEAEATPTEPRKREGTLRYTVESRSAAEEASEPKPGQRRGLLRYSLEPSDPDWTSASAEEGATTPPPPPTLATTNEPHDRGGFLVAAVFDAFVTIYERRTADLLRLTLGQSTPDGRELPLDLVHRLAVEAGKAADHLLRMCVRGIDYLPVTDVHFGEYLRAVVTADADLVPDDPMRYRVALAEAFRKRGIYVPDCISMAPDSLMWESPDLGVCLAQLETSGKLFAKLLPNISVTSQFVGAANLLRTEASDNDSEPQPVNLRKNTQDIIRYNQAKVWEWINREITDDRAEWESLLGLSLGENAPLSITRSRSTGRPAVEVHSARIARRAGPNGEELHQLVIQVTQRRRGYDDEQMQTLADSGDLEAQGPERWRDPDFWFRGGATLLIDMRDGRLRTVVRKSILDAKRLERHRNYRSDFGINFSVGKRRSMAAREPFAFIHEEQP